LFENNARNSGLNMSALNCIFLC